MKKLYLIRHAKSDWDDPALEDFERGLNKRGRRNIPIMGKALRDKNIKPDLIISSSAKRAKLTAKGLAKELGYSKDIRFLKKLYFSEPKTWFDVIRDINKKYETVFIIGHNPEITDVCNMLIDDYIDNVPTLGIAGFKIGLNKWKSFERENASFEFLIYPKMYK
jgi:phosphohistidine phosphatase